MSKGSERFHELLKEIGNLHDLKQEDYGTTEDPFANVRGSEDWGVEAWKGAMIRATDKVKRLQKYAREGKLANEGARDSFMDLAVYSLIGLNANEVKTRFNWIESKLISKGFETRNPIRGKKINTTDKGFIPYEPREI